MDREDFVNVVYGELADDPDNCRANRIIEAADEYAADKNVGTKISREPLELARAIDGLTEWQKHVQTDSNINRDITVAIEALKAQLGTNLAEVGTRAVIGYPIDADALMEKVAEEYGERARNRLYQIIRYMPPAQPEPCEIEKYVETCEKCGFCDTISRQAAINALNDAVHEHNITDFDAVATILALPSVTPKQRTGALKAEIKRMKRSFTTCINSDYYTGYMCALSAVEGYISQWEGDAE